MPRERFFWLEFVVPRHRRIPVSVLAASVNNTEKSDSIFAKVNIYLMSYYRAIETHPRHYPKLLKIATGQRHFALNRNPLDVEKCEFCKDGNSHPCVKFFEQTYL
jgi:hypothetical protein